MANSYKAVALARELANKLYQRLPRTFVISQLFDTTDGNPYITINDGTPAAGEPNFLIKVKSVDWTTAQDVLGLNQTVYTPHVIQLVTEADPTGGAGADPTTRAQLLPVIGQCVLMGAILEWYESASGVAPSLSTITAGNLKSTFHPNQQYPLISAQ